jgi:membrane protease YdiL (CAAX protease family)/uncharacterized RDD family membrane protein YckC
VDWNGQAAEAHGWSAPAAARPSAPIPSLGGYTTVYAAAQAWRKTAAALINLAILAVGGFLVLSVIGNAAASQGLANARAGSGLLYVALSQAVLVVGVIGYYLRGWRNGATPGMRSLGLVVVDATSGDLLRTDQALLRMAGGFWSLVVAFAGLVWSGLSRDRRGWHDRLAGTLVVQSTVLPWYWQWSGSEWVAATPSLAMGVPTPTGRRPDPSRVERSRWTWTDVLPIAVLQLPVAFVGQLAVVTATRAVGLGRPSRSVGSLILDVVGYGFIALLVWLFLGLRRRVGLADLGLRPVRWRWMAAAVPALIVAYATEIVFGEIGEVLLPASPATQCHDIQSAYGTSLLLGLIGVAVVAPLVEEVLFRGVVFGWMRGPMPLPLAVVGSALVFSAAHVLYLQWTLLPPVFGIGCVLALLYHYSRSLWPGIAVHASINTVATLALLLGAVHC